MGEPMVLPWRTPERMWAVSLLDAHAAAAAVALLAAPELVVEEAWSTGTPAGSPLTRATRLSPWLSPAVEKRNMVRVNPNACAGLGFNRRYRGCGVPGT